MTTEPVRSTNTAATIAARQAAAVAPPPPPSDPKIYTASYATPSFQAGQLLTLSQFSQWQQEATSQNADQQGPQLAAAIANQAIAAAAGPAPIPFNPLTNPAPVSVPTANYTASEVAGNFYYNADVELVQNQLDIYGDTWDSAAAIVNNLYANGTQPGTVTLAQALAGMTGVTATGAAATTASSLPSFLLTATGAPNYWLIGGGLLAAYWITKGKH